MIKVCEYCNRGKTYKGEKMCSNCRGKYKLCGDLIEMVKQAKEERDRGEAGKRD